MKKNKNPIKKQKKKGREIMGFWEVVRLASDLGFIIVLPMIGGLFLGLFLDSFFGCRPILTLVFLTGGLIFGCGAVAMKMRDL